AFLNQVLNGPGYVVWERYMTAAPDERAARRTIDEKLLQPMQLVHELFPGKNGRILMCPSIWAGVGQFNHNIHTDVDQKVFLDMQWHTMATHPLYRGLGGIAPWTSGYASPEVIRWLGALYQHYAI